MSSHFSDLTSKGAAAKAAPAGAPPAAPKLPVPAFSDIAKPSNDVSETRERGEKASPRARE
ncbi:MAG: hypothetical protein INR71_15345 [Terriglobus roseus]|nr:hypothetical protein [Terriglobus roseus]